MILQEMYTILSADSTLTTLLTGGIHYQSATINTDDTPTAYDPASKLLRPCALLLSRSSTPQGASVFNNEQVLVDVYLYELYGYSTIESARDRIYQLLHRECIAGTQDCRHEQDLPLTLRDETLRAYFTRSTFYVRLIRKALT